MTRKIFFHTFELGVLVLVISIVIFFGLEYRRNIDETYEALQGEASYAVRGLEAGGPGYLKSLDNTNRVTWISHDGEVLYDSVHPDMTASQRECMEVREALETGTGRGIRRSTSDGTQTMYYAILCRDGTVLRLARPLRAVLTAFLAVSPVLWAVFLVLLVSAVAAFRIADNISRPINEMDLDDLPNAAPYPELEPLVGRLDQQRQTIRRQVREREEQSRARERMRREFTANVSHELKTPLTSISGFAELMSSGMCDNEKMIEFSGDILHESRRLMALVSDILHLSELDELTGMEKNGEPGADTGADGRHDTEVLYRTKQPVDLFVSARDAVQRLQPAAEKSGVTLSIEGETVYVLGIPRFLEEIVYNLCDNAIKYNREGGRADVQVYAEEAETGEACAVLVVEDTGIGIPAEEQERIFERFYRVDKSHSRRIGGTGLGLSIVKHGAQFHGASISLHSEPGKGTRIMLRFPPPGAEAEKLKSEAFSPAGAADA